MYLAMDADVSMVTDDRHIATDTTRRDHGGTAPDQPVD